MSGLLTLAGMLVGGGIGGCVGMGAAMVWADMDLGNLDALAYVLGGIAVGAAGGAYLAAEFVA
jgi:hypothetical protein